jgi:hypothetical protein
MARRKYVARAQGPVSDKEARIIAREANSMLKEGVPLTPKALLERAADRSCPAHALFQWDDRKAADSYRLQQARSFVGSVYIVTVERKPPQKAYFSIEREGKREYVPRQIIEDGDEEKLQVSQDLYERILSAVQTADGLKLGRTYPAWREIINTVKRNRPPGP